MPHLFALHPCRIGLVVVTVGFSAFLGGMEGSSAAVNVLTYHNDLARTGQNTNETQLTWTNVNVTTFGKVFSYPVDGFVYAQTLYVSNLNLPGQGLHNVLFVATEHNSVYAFDADSNQGARGGLLWQRNLGPSAATPNGDFGSRYGGHYTDILPEVGITSTPVIDLASGTIYVDAFTHEGSGYLHRIHALSITTGEEQPGSPSVVSAQVPGQGVGSTNSVLEFNPQQQLQRPALTLAGGVLYTAYSGYADTDPYHGWVIGFDAHTLQPLSSHVFCTTPNATVAEFGVNAGEGGIWMSGAGLAVDTQTNLFLEVGNGSFTANQPGGTEYGDSFVKLSTAGALAVADYFAPYNQAALAADDTDLGSGGPMLLPDEVGSAAHPHLLVGCGKEGKIYLLDRDNLGKFNATNDSQAVQEVLGIIAGTWSSPAYFNGYIYYQGAGDVLKAFPIANGAMATNASSGTRTYIRYPSSTPSISANGTNNAIVWLLQTDAFGTNGPAVLHAFYAYDLSLEFYNSSQAGSRDTMAPAVKFTLPTIANGKVYAGAQGEVDVFGILQPPAFTTTSLSGGRVNLGWTGPGTLEEAPTPLGPWTTSASQQNPQSLSPGGQRYYRLRE